MSNIRIAGRTVRVQDIARFGVGMAYDRAGRAGEAGRYRLGRILREGSRGPDVIELRQALSDAGMDVQRATHPQIFDSELTATLRSYQNSMRLRPTGIMDRSTETALQSGRRTR